MLNLNEITLPEFRDFVGNGVFTVEFIKKDGSYRKLNGRLGVKKYVKGTTPEATAKRAETNASKLQIGVYEMKGTSDRCEAENYRTLTIDPERLISLTANGERLVNPVLEARMVLGDFYLGTDKPLPVEIAVNT